MTTHAQQKGLKIGRTYELKTNTYNSHQIIGMIVKFVVDDGTHIPYFQIKKVSTGSEYKVNEVVCLDIRDELILQSEPTDNTEEILDTKAILKKYISTKYPGDTFLDFLVEHV